MRQKSPLAICNCLSMARKVPGLSAPSCTTVRLHGMGEWNGRLPPLMPAVGRVEVDPHGPTASKCQGGRFGVFPGKPEGPR